MIQMVAKVLKILNSESDPGQISLALCFAMVAGLTPFFSLHILLTQTKTHYETAYLGTAMEYTVSSLTQRHRF